MAKTTLSEQAHKAAIAQVQAEKPSSFTVGGHWDGKKLQGGVTFSRDWRNGFGLTAYLYAYWNDLPISTYTPKTNMVTGFEASKKF